MLSWDVASNTPPRIATIQWHNSAFKDSQGRKINERIQLFTGLISENDGVFQKTGFILEGAMLLSGNRHHGDLLQM